MPWNSSGTFSRKTTTVSPATSGTTVDSADMNSYTTDVTGGINACRAKNGENAATGNLPMGGFKHTNVADGTARTEYASVGQGQDGSTQYAADTGAADAYEVDLSPVVTSNVVGRKTSFKVKAGGTNTGASTLDLNSIGAESIKRYDGTALEAGDIVATRIYDVVWDGTNYILQDQVSRGVFVNAADGGAWISSTALDVDSILVNATWESVGPTSPGTSDNVWAVLDAVPVGVDWIEVYVNLKTAQNSTATLFAYLSARETGSSVTNGLISAIAYAVLDDGTSSNKTVTHISRGIKIPVNGDIEFDLYRWGNGSSTETINLYLTGYGWN